MKAYVAAPVVQSRSIGRVAEALATYAPPSVEIVTDKDAADLVVLHVIGRRDQMLAEAARLVGRGQAYAVMQYVLKSTQKPDPWDWAVLWIAARVTWSYLDLAAALGPCYDDSPRGRFYHAPLGVDADVFRPMPLTQPGRWLIGTSGQSWLTESVRECAHAALRVGGSMFHLGPDMAATHVMSVSGLTDEQLAYYWSACQFVSGLRRIEGFELPAVEGLLCGARPVLFDKPHYRRWYGAWADYIEETDRAGVIDQLEALFRRGARPVTTDERAAAVARFNWSTLVPAFWQRCGA